MKSARSSVLGETRICPHCKDTILKSATVCPACHHFLQFDAVTTGVSPSVCPLQIEGTIRHPDREKPCEYSVVLEVCDEGGEVISRRVIGVGTIRASQVRTFSVRVEVSPHDRPAA
ncbi:MAG: hypothetical protein ACE5MK_05580 [Acidobacteriota bacterium]